MKEFTGPNSRHTPMRAMNTARKNAPARAPSAGRRAWMTRQVTTEASAAKGKSIRNANSISTAVRVMPPRAGCRTPYAGVMMAGPMNRPTTPTTRATTTNVRGFWRSAVKDGAGTDLCAIGPHLGRPSQVKDLTTSVNHWPLTYEQPVAVSFEDRPTDTELGSYVVRSSLDVAR